MMELFFELGTPEETLLNEINELKLPQRHIAQTYALAIKSSHVVDWPKVNQAIIDRWNYKTLDRIKVLAWKWKDSF